MGDNGASPQRRSWTFRVSRHFISRADITSGEKITALAILAYADKKGLCCPTLIQLGADLGMHPDTVETHTDGLRSAGVLSWTLWTDEHGHRRRAYFLASENGERSKRLFIAPTEWDGLGGKAQDGRRTMQNPPG